MNIVYHRIKEDIPDIGQPDAVKRQHRMRVFLNCCILLGCLLHLTPFLYHRTLWYDEAMLACSVCTRSFSQLLAGNLDWGQSASVGWLILTKLTTLLFGSSETSLRLWSLLSSFGCIALLVATVKSKVRMEYMLYFTAVFTLSNNYIYYSNEAKPYMLDNFVCLLVLFLWQKYKDRKISLTLLTISFADLIWFSFSAVFFIAACMILEVIRLLTDFRRQLRQRQSVLHSLLGFLQCGLVLVSFAANYLFWLSNTGENAGGKGFWDNLKFPIIPRSTADLKLYLAMIKEFLSFYPILLSLFCLVLYILYSIQALKKKDDSSHLLLPTILSLLLLLIASSLGYYPIIGRLVQVFLIVLTEIAAFACTELCIPLPQRRQTRHSHRWNVFFSVLLALNLLWTGLLGCVNLRPFDLRFNGFQVDENMSYLKDHLQPDDGIYIYYYAIPTYQYETDYEASYQQLTNLPTVLGSTIYGQDFTPFDYVVPYSYAYQNNNEAIQQDIDLILQYDASYIFTTHLPGISCQGLLDQLGQYGHVEVAHQTNATMLYYFTKY